ncbi:MAG: Na+/H+ antiporter NhaC family protein [Clostridiales bacterium]|jgi:Na+/H+ antiporter NhaC|nr:Na+/H+ antiporter NhaC family protein [Clostridiales bacterium]
MDKTKKSSGLALIPFLVFIVIYLGAGIVLQSRGVEMAFYQFPAVVAMFISVLTAFAINYKAGINENFRIFAKGAGSEDIMCMLMIFLLAGGFSSVAGAMGGVDATVNLGVSIIPASLLTAGLFVIAAFLGTATGTSMGTIGALVPIALGVVDKAGLSLPLVMAAVVSGAMFGDNLSMISDTTIAATRTQGVELRDKFRTNFWIAFPAAVVTIILLVIFGRPESSQAIVVDQFSFIKVIPYILVLVLALAGVNVYLDLTIGIFSAGIIGMAYGDLTFLDFAVRIWEGFQGMIEVFLLSMLVGGIAEMAKEYGGINWLIEKISKTIKGKKSAQLGLSALAALTDACTANNTVAIIVDGPMAKGISEQYGVDPRKTASILDVFACIVQGLIPYGAQFLVVASLCEGRVSPMDIIPDNWYLFLLAFFAILSYFVPWYEKITLKGRWDWEENRVVND